MEFYKTIRNFGLAGIFTVLPNICESCSKSSYNNGKAQAAEIQQIQLTHQPTNYESRLENLTNKE